MMKYSDRTALIWQFTTCNDHNETHHGLFRMLPSVDDLLLMPACQELLNAHRRNAVLRGCPQVARRVAAAISRQENTPKIACSKASNCCLTELPSNSLLGSVTRSAR